jgi:hypothetical protein
MVREVPMAVKPVVVRIGEAKAKEVHRFWTAPFSPNL